MIAGATGTKNGAGTGTVAVAENPSGATQKPPADHRALPDQEVELARAFECAKKLAASLRSLSKTLEPRERGEFVANLQIQADELGVLCKEANWRILADFVGALHKMLRLFERDSAKINVSTLRTAANAVDFLNAVFSVAADLRSIEKAPLRALVIDDNDTCRRAVVLSLTSDNIQVFTASSGEEAMENLRQNEYDVVFTDIMMPRLNGFALLKLLRACPNHTKTPVVFVTALSDFETRSRSILSGGCDLVAKPITPSEVLLKAFTFALRGRFPECRRRAPKASAPETPLPTQVTGVLGLDERGIVQTINEEAAVMFGFKPAEILGLPVTRVFPNDLQIPENQNRLPQLLANPSPSGSFIMVACRKNASLLQLVANPSRSSADNGGLSLLLRYANPSEAPKSFRDTEMIQKPVAPRAQPVSSADLNQTLEAVQTQLRLQIQQHCSEQRQLHARIAALERELAESKKREAALERELNHDPERRNA